MRIGFDAKRAFSNNTGLGNYSRFTISAIAAMYPENTYCLYTPDENKAKLFSAPENTQIALPEKIWLKSLKSYWRSFGITRQLVNDGIEIFHGLSNEIPFGLDKSGIKSVVSIHDLIFLRLPKLYRSVDRHIYLKKVKYAVESADRIIAISNQTKDDLIELLGADEQKIKIIYQGCNPWFYKKESNERRSAIRSKYALPKDYLLYVGTIEERKNLLEIVRAMHIDNIDIPLVAIGRKTGYFEEIKKYISDHQIKHIHFYHHIENQDLPSVYQSATAFIYPSSYEGFGIPVLEALNSGIPVITSRGGCLEETAGSGGLFVSPGQTEELGSAINSIIHDSGLRKSLQEEGARHALLFREEKTIPLLNELYMDCLR